MERLFLEKTEDTPQVEFDQGKNIFIISGRSLPENAVSFYDQLLDWLRDYGQKPNRTSNFDFKLDYFNTASAKQITKLLLVLQTLSEKSEIIIRWFYFEEDTDIQSSGIRFSKLIHANIQLIPYD